MGRKKRRPQNKKESSDDTFPNAAQQREKETLQQSPSVPPSHEHPSNTPPLHRTLLKPAPALQPSPTRPPLSTLPLDTLLDVAGPSSRQAPQQTSQQSSLHLHEITPASRTPRSPPLVPPSRRPCTTSMRETPLEAILLRSQQYEPPQRVSCIMLKNVQCIQAHIAKVCDM